MSTDLNYSDFQPLYEGQKPRPYHFFKIYLLIQNTSTLERITGVFYISTKFSINWLSKIVSNFRLPYPREYFSVTLKICEVEDSEIVFQHITSQESFDRIAIATFFEIVLQHRWKLSISDKVKKFFKKIRTFWKNRLFIYRNKKIITV